MKYYLCYAKEDIKKAFYIKNLFSDNSIDLEDLSKDLYTTDVLESILSKIDSSDVLIILHSYSFLASTLCRLQLVYACKTVKAAYCIKLDSAPMEKAFLSEYKSSFVFTDQLFDKDVKHILDKEKENGENI